MCGEVEGGKKNKNKKKRKRKRVSNLGTKEWQDGAGGKKFA